MAVAMMVLENVNNALSSCPSGKSEGVPNGSYYKFYQAKLRQLVTQTRYRKEQEVRITRERQSKTSSNDNNNRISEQRLHKEYMNHIRERTKIQAQEILSNKTDEPKKRSDSVLSKISNRTITLNITSTPVESRPKYRVRTKQTPVPPPPPPPPPKQQRITSAPTSRQRKLNRPKITQTVISVPSPCQENSDRPKITQTVISAPSPREENLDRPKLIPIIKIDGVEESLSEANSHSFTQVSSSSSQNSNDKISQHARQLILDTIMLHLNSHIPSNTSIWPTFEDIDQKFSSSIAPTVYNKFERIAV